MQREKEKSYIGKKWVWMTEANFASAEELELKKSRNLRMLVHFINLKNYWSCYFYKLVQCTVTLIEYR